MGSSLQNSLEIVLLLREEEIGVTGKFVGFFIATGHILWRYVYNKYNKSYRPFKNIKLFKDYIFVINNDFRSFKI